MVNVNKVCFDKSVDAHRKAFAMQENPQTAHLLISENF